MVHRKEKHPNFVRMCRNYNEGKCPFADSKCWWNHKQIQSSPQEVKCFVCEEKFDNKPSMMSHRKKKHYEIVRPCIQYKQNSCRFQADFCWFKHEAEEQKQQSSVFQKVSGNLKPPNSVL